MRPRSTDDTSPPSCCSLHLHHRPACPPPETHIPASRPPVLHSDTVQGQYADIRTAARPEQWVLACPLRKVTRLRANVPRIRRPIQRQPPRGANIAIARGPRSSDAIPKHGTSCWLVVAVRAPSILTCPFQKSQLRLTHSVEAPKFRRHGSWIANPPMTLRELHHARTAFWETADTFGGRKEVWDTLRAAVDCDDAESATTILGGANLRLLGNGDLIHGCYDSTGFFYKIPENCLSDPSNLQKDDVEPSVFGTTQVVEDFPEAQLLDLKVRLSHNSQVGLIHPVSRPLSCDAQRLIPVRTCWSRWRWRKRSVPYRPRFKLPPASSVSS